MKPLIPLILVLLLFWITPLPAQEQDNFPDDVIEIEFPEGENFELNLEDGEAYESPSPFRFNLDHQASYRIGENPALINNRSGFSIEYGKSIAEDYYLKIDFYENLYWSNDHVADSAGEIARVEGFLREAWIQRSLESFNLKLGYQNIVWNEVDGSLATDLINPVDYREILFVDFEEARVSQLMLSIAIYGNSITWEGFINPQPQFNKNPPLDSIYHVESPLDAYPVSEGEATEGEFGVKAKLKLGVSEIALIMARLVPNQKEYELRGSVLLEKYDPFNMVAVTFNYPIGTTLFKGDLGYKKDQGINDLSFGLLKRDIVDVAFMVEHNQDEHMVSASFSNSYILDWDPSLIFPEKTSFLTFGWSKSFLNEDLSINAGLMGVTGEDMRIFSLYSDYKLNDAVSLQTGLLLFSIEDTASEFYAFRNENRVSLKMAYKL
ncbi:MAG: hypothetical protein OEY59_10990 [Deltaproteobacteria bacterium]|nr:hypothetical protein [Deltaproteobacteria bacterium]